MTGIVIAGPGSYLTLVGVVVISRPYCLLTITIAAIPDFSPELGSLELG